MSETRNPKRRSCLEILALGAATFTLCTATGCKRSSSSEPRRSQQLDEETTAFARAALERYADIAQAGYSESLAAAKRLLAAVDGLLRAPSPVTLAEARAGWIEARRPYAQTEVFRFYEGPIDRWELLINTWPIDESYVEAGNAEGMLGIIEDIAAYPELSPAVLGALNAKQGETSISTGYHVLEFLLWGKDTRAGGPGDRPYMDFVTRDAKGKDAAIRARSLAARRGHYLRSATELLISQLSLVRDEWVADRAGNYREGFLKMPPHDALGLVIKGMGALSGAELAGERLTVAYETKDQENEHSCFSDTTEKDLVQDAVGISNVCLGRYGSLDAALPSGPGICDLIARRDGELGERLKREIAASIAALEAIPGPFDQAILGDDAAPGRQAIQAAIRALELQTNTLAEVAAAWDIRLSLAKTRLHR